MPLTEPPNPMTTSRRARIVHIQNAPPDNAPGIDIERIALMDVVVDDGRQEVVGQPDGMNVSGKVEVDVPMGRPAHNRPRLRPL